MSNENENRRDQLIRHLNIRKRIFWLANKVLDDPSLTREERSAYQDEANLLMKELRESKKEQKDQNGI